MNVKLILTALGFSVVFVLGCWFVGSRIFVEHNTNPYKPQPLLPVKRVSSATQESLEPPPESIKDVNGPSNQVKLDGKALENEHRTSVASEVPDTGVSVESEPMNISDMDMNDILDRISLSTFPSKSDFDSESAYLTAISDWESNHAALIARLSEIIGMTSKELFGDYEPLDPDGSVFRSEVTEFIRQLRDMGLDTLADKAEKDLQNYEKTR